MNSIFHNKQLTLLNTFGLESVAKEFFEFDTEDDLIDLIKSNALNNKKILILGGGSNLLLSEKIKAMVLHSKIKGITVINNDSDTITIEAGSGIVWDDFVQYCVNNNYYGIENLSLIPGTIGASPVQNIGAYGVEAGDLIVGVTGIDLLNGEKRYFTSEECCFGYRSSIFKTTYKNSFLITKVQFRLRKRGILTLGYGDVKAEAESMYGGVTIENVRKAIVSIREKKLPNPDEFGNAGSFFKNPVVTNELAQKLKILYPELPIYQLENGNVKLAAGWMIEATGWKGKTVGSVGVHEKQALVIINKGGAMLNDVLKLADMVTQSVIDKFGVELEMEVNVF
ncbi:MAG: UDP-N-acetylmuramate dehydrogenase [Marinilabiliaceae bacterium]|nr:UDP-N-acetylmuramate dehydrogenase [Marinilabiliaceae bacterium]